MAVGVGWTRICSNNSGGPYTRPSDWLPMPTLVDGDDEVALLAAVWTDEQVNYVALYATTSSGTYTVDWGDGNVTTHASGTNADHNLDWNGVSPSTLTSKGYRQAMIRVTATTGNLTGFIGTVMPSARTVFYDLPWLECNIASQTILNISDMFKNGAGSLSTPPNTPYMERFEWIGTCNATNGYYAFAFIGLGEFIGDFPKITSCQNMFQSARITIMKAKFGSATAHPNCSSMFYGASVEHFEGVDITEASNLNGCFIGTGIKFFGTKDNPIVFTQPNVSINQIFSGSFGITEVHMVGSFVGPTNSFYQCGRLRQLSITLQDSTNNTNFILQGGYSLTGLSIPGCKASISFADKALSIDQIENIFTNDLADLTGNPTQTFTLTNTPASALLTPTIIAIATAKNWTVVN